MTQPQDKQQLKDDSREGRLKWSKRAETHLREELAYYARDQCKDAMSAFAQCAKENGMLVVLKCRTLNKQMNDCLSQYTTDSKFEEWKAKRASSLEEGGGQVKATK